MKKLSFICLVAGLSLAIVAGSFAADNGHRSLLYPISQILPDEMIPEPTRWHQPDLIPNTYFAVLVLVLFFILATRKLKRIPEGKGQTLLEVFVGGIMDFFGGILGDHGKKYVPFVGSFFIFILFLNYLGVIPGLQPPTADLNTTLALGITAVLGVQIIAIKENGIGGYLKHLAGNPPWLGVLMFPLEVVAQLSRAGSLAVRLFGNIFGEKAVVIELTKLGLIVLIADAIPIIPVQVPMLFFGLFAGFLQAFVFTILTSIYIVLFIEHHDDAHEAHH
ncbi:MAG: F0F1 ATP synthase subunit A [Candidatus Poribacteria bacterium]|nr:F0F1 ATP synthase subunit A [Candidatus Poribacteria bacterium]MDE0685627.1 F0F1 ATP synthase subunit A [Candidatus Poribacteria bacterium]